MKTSPRNLIISILAFVMMATLCLSVARLAPSVSAAADAPTGKIVVGDFDTKYNTGFKTERLVETTESAFSVGNMMRIGPFATLWTDNYGLNFGCENDWYKGGPTMKDLTGVKYGIFYVDNQTENDMGLFYVIKTHANKQYQVTNGVKYVLDKADGTTVSSHTVGEDNLMYVPAGYKGYVKVDMTGESWHPVWDGDETLAQVLTDVCGIEVWYHWDIADGEKIYMDTIAYSYDDDIDVPFTAETARLGRLVQTGKHIVTDFDTLYSMAIKADNTIVPTTEGIHPTGNMSRVMIRDHGYWSGDLGTQYTHCDFPTDEKPLQNWESARYISFYLENPNAETKPIWIAIQTIEWLVYSSDANFANGNWQDEQWRPNVGTKVYFDDLSGEMTYDEAYDYGIVDVPANFKGYVKVAVDNPLEWTSMWGGNRTGFDVGDSLYGIQVWDQSPENAGMTFDTVVVSFDDDMLTPYTKEVAKFGRIYPDTRALVSYINDNKLVETDYHTGWENYLEKLAAANAVLENEEAGQVDVDNALANLKAAVAGLIRFADKTDLQEKYNVYIAMTPDNYTADSFAVLTEKLADAKALLDNEKASQTDVDNAIAALEGAVAALMIKVNTEELTASVNTAKGLVAADYTADSFAAVTEKLADAEAVLADASASQMAVDRALFALNEAIAALVEAEKPDDSSSISTPDSPSVSDSSSSSEGCFGSVSAGLIGITLAISAIVVAKKKRND